MCDLDFKIFFFTENIITLYSDVRICILCVCVKNSIPFTCYIILAVPSKNMFTLITVCPPLLRAQWVNVDLMDLLAEEAAWYETMRQMACHRLSYCMYLYTICQHP